MRRLALVSTGIVLGLAAAHWPSAWLPGHAARAQSFIFAENAKTLTW